LEKALLLGDPDIEAARGFRRADFDAVGGYDESINAAEDWSLADRIARLATGPVGRTGAGVNHLEDELHLGATFRKKRYYGGDVRGVARQAPASTARRIVRVRFAARLAAAAGRDPLTAVGLVVLKAVEFAGIGAGMLGARPRDASSVYGPVAADRHRAGSSYLIATHEMFEDGAAQALYRYLVGLETDVSLLLLPFGDAPDGRIGWSSPRTGHTVRRSFPQLPVLPARLARDAVALVAVALRHRRTTTYIGVDPFNCGVGLLLRRLRVWSPTIVLYSIDFVPERFANRWANRTYHAIERWSATKADVVWNVSSELIAARTERDGGRRGAPQLVVPIGIDAVAAEPPPCVPRLAFIGHLIPKQGVQRAIAALPEIAASLDEVHLDIAGIGPAQAELRELADELGVSERVEFVGYVRTAEEIGAFLARGGVGVATYEDDPSSFTRWADPTKLKTYAAAGLPILVTEVAPRAQELVTAGAARLVSSQPSSIAGAALGLLEDNAAYGKASAAARDWASGFAWDRIFESALRSTKEALGDR
jgi:glycosyltransferase involved in cell wall biosynthesis